MKTLFFYTFIGTLISIFVGAGVFYYFEEPLNAQVASYGDALWFSIGTATLLGLGDILPETWGGRIVSVFLMGFGFFFLAAFATLGSWSIIQMLLRERKNKIILDVTPDSDLDDALEDLKHLSHLDRKRLSELEKIYEKIFHVEKIP